jgi:tetratricopeptide (TPR) repeat protein
MTTEDNMNSPQERTFRLFPWLAAVGALLLYGITLDHWVTLNSLPVIARITGWDWHPLTLSWRQTQSAPLFLVLTCPIRLLPVPWQPAALNAFTAFCAAATLGLLAASVRLLPHDRTKEQRQRESGAFSLLSLPTAFLPVLFAVLIMGFQLTFWRNAISATGEMLDVLVFALLIFCLLKFRISQNDNWLAVFAFLYGLGTANNWALIGFFPFFFVAMIWIKGINFFNWRFLGRVAGCGFLGLLLYLLIPAISSLGGDRANFFSILRLEFGAQSFGLRMVPRWIAAVAALPTLLPLIFAGICWPSFEGEVSAAGNQLTKLMFRLLHVFFLVLALSMFFDFQHSPSSPLKDAPGIGFLTFYYLGALCVGYYSGYILLVYGRPPGQAWEKRGPVSRIFNLLIVGLLWLLAVAAPCGLLYQNIPRINAGRNNVLADFSRETIQCLPAKQVILLCDDPVRLYLLQAAFCREGKPDKNILIDTTSLLHREYIAYLISRYPELKKLTTQPEKLPRFISSDALVKYLYGLSRKYPLYYLNPSFGYYFEAFYSIPHGLVYELQTYPKDATDPPLATSQVIKENQDVWTKLEQNSLATLPSLAKLDPGAEAIGDKYSVALDFWGVELQKAGYLKEANAQFAEAARINTNNFIAKINKEYNERLLKNDHRPVNSGDLIFKAINLYRGMLPILKFNGPVDEPDLDLEIGALMADGHDLRQAAALFERRLQLLPGDVPAQLSVAKVFVDSGMPDKAIELVRKLRANPTASKWEVSRVEALAYYAKNDFATAERLMKDALKENPQDENRIAILAEFYRVTGYAALHQTNSIEASRRFTNSLLYLNQELKLPPAAGQNAASRRSVPDTLLKKAEVEMMLKSFPASIATLSQIMELQPNNATALLNRAIAEVQVNQFQAAREDYKALRKLMPRQLYVADYGLADIAARQKNTTEQIRCLKRYLDSAPDDLPEYQQVKKQLRKLESH